jgi:hypothetical protein
VDERSSEAHAAFARQPGKRRRLKELTSGDRHWLLVTSYELRVRNYAD